MSHLGRRGMCGGEPTHDLAHTLLPLDLRGYYFISQGALAHHSKILGIIPNE